MLHKLARILAAATLTIAATAIAAVGIPGTAYADSCYTWNRVLQQGSSGADVAQLQIRVSGYPGYGANLVVDGVFGAHTAAAVTRFQQAYGLGADGVAGTQTYNKIYELQDADCTPIHFTYPELNRCNSDWSGGAVSPAAARANALQLMWQLEALRHALGDRPLSISDGFRSYPCGATSVSRHPYGEAADIIGAPTFCTIALQARYHGFEEILGPGYPDHDDHAHISNKPFRYWHASGCGI